MVGAGVVGTEVGDSVGDGVRESVGDGLGEGVGDGVIGDGVFGDGVGERLGESVGDGVGDGVGVGVGGVGPGGVDVFVPVQATGGVHDPVLRHTGHIAPSVHAKLEERSQPPETKWSLMAHMPEPAPVIWLFPKYL